MHGVGAVRAVRRQQRRHRARVEHIQDARVAERAQLAGELPGLSRTAPIARRSTHRQTFLDLPDAPKVTFRDAPGVVLATLLPHLPSHDRDREEGSGDRDLPHFPPREMSPTPLDLIHRLLVYPPSSRLAAVDALRHPWFTEDAPLLLPQTGMDLPPHAQTTWQDKPLARWLSALLPAAEERPGVDADSEEDEETNPIA